jgi:hypothetical protein
MGDGGRDMQRMILITAALMGTNAAAFASCPTVIGPGSRGYCVTVPAPGNGAYVLGIDTGRSTYWTTDIDPRGNMYGFDIYGNYWAYDRRTDTYRYFDTTREW